MPGILTQPSSSNTLGPTPGELCLRVVGARKDSQLVRLRSAKCTIGSDPNCTLRVRARGVDAVSCLVLRGKLGSVVRNWSGQSLINGRTFVDAAIGVGDRLKCGSVEFEVMALADPSGSDSSQSGAMLNDVRDETNHQIEELLAQREELQTQQQALAAAKDSLQIENQALQVRKSQFADEQSIWNNRLSDENQLLEALANQLQSEQARWSNERQAEIDDLARQRAELTQQTDEIIARHEALVQTQSKVEEQQRMLEQASANSAQTTIQTQRSLEEAEAKLRARDIELQTQSQQVADLQRSLDHKSTELSLRQSELHDQESQLKHDRDLLTQATLELEQQRQSLTAAQQALDLRDQEVQQLLSNRDSVDAVVGELEARRIAFEADCNNAKPLWLQIALLSLPSDRR